MFISIVPGTKKDIDTLIERNMGHCISSQSGGYYNKLNKYLNKIVFALHHSNNFN